MKYHITTYGCQMNIADSERIAGVFEQIGYKKSQNLNEADLVIVNMCSVRQSAVDRICGISQKLIQSKSKKKGQKTILTGCMLKQDIHKFEAKFDFVFNIKDLKNWPKYLKGKELGKKDFCKILVKPKRQNDFLAYIPISNGCNNFCSYCVVPYVRGKEECINHQQIINEAKESIAGGAKEIWLLGQNVNSYKSPKNKIINFPQLLKMVNDIPGNFWIRFTSPHPKDLSDKLIEAMKACKKVTPYLNLPIQSGNNQILKKMNRPYTTNHYKKIITKVRHAIPEIFLSTDIIVGFPGETKKQFEETRKFFEEIGFDMAYILKYSPRPGTASEKMKDSVEKKEKENRYRILTESLKKSALKNNQKMIGKNLETLVLKETKNMLEGKTNDYRNIVFEGSKRLIGKFVLVKIINATPWGLKGKIISF